MDKILSIIEEKEFTTREFVFAGVSLFLLGVLMGILFSPKGERSYGCNNGNNNSGCLCENEGFDEN